MVSNYVKTRSLSIATPNFMPKQRSTRSTRRLHGCLLGQSTLHGCHLQDLVRVHETQPVVDAHLARSEWSEILIQSKLRWWKMMKTHRVFEGLPSGKRLHNYGKWPFLMDKSTISMAIFNSYVSLPEAKETDVLLVQSPGLWHLILRTRDPFLPNPAKHGRRVKLHTYLPSSKLT